MGASINKIYEVLNEMAPFETAEGYDNVGILAGHPDSVIETILVSLDLTLGALDEAQAIGAGLIVTHHPILFHARKNLREDDPEGSLLCRLIRSGIALIAVHTNFDTAQGGVSDVLANALNLKNIEADASNMLRIGSFEGTLLALLERAKETININTRVYGSDKQLSKVAVCGGAGGELWMQAQLAGADALLTGEVRHHDALNAVQSGISMLDAGHYETERLSVKALVDGLQKRLNALQYNVRAFASEFEPFI